jgi:nitroreductase
LTDWIAAMQRRHSVRRYSQEALAPQQVAALEQALQRLEPLDAAASTDLRLIAFSDIGKRRAVALLPTQNAAPLYLIVAGPDVPGRMEEAGFRGEQLVLAASSLGLDTCWLGGTFRPDAIAAVAGMPRDDILAISPIGVAERGALQAIAGTLTRPFTSRSGRRKPLEGFTFGGRWGVPADRARVPPAVWQALEMARIAPSWANTQPWAFLVVEDVLWAFADSRPQRGNDVSHKPYYRLDAGIAMAHVHLAMAQNGYSSTWRPLAEPLDPSLQVPPHFVPLAWRPIA